MRSCRKPRKASKKYMTSKKPGRGYTLNDKGERVAISKKGIGGRQPKKQSEKKQSKTITLSPFAAQVYSESKELREKVRDYVEREAKKIGK